MFDVFLARLSLCEGTRIDSLLVSVVISKAEYGNVCPDDLKLIKLYKVCPILWDNRGDDFVNKKEPERRRPWRAREHEPIMDR
jgi:hypothetical protein